MYVNMKYVRLFSQRGEYRSRESMQIKNMKLQPVKITQAMARTHPVNIIQVKCKAWTNLNNNDYYDKEDKSARVTRDKHKILSNTLANILAAFFVFLFFMLCTKCKRIEKD